MPTLVEMILFVGLAVLLAFAGMFLVRRSVQLSALEAHKEAAGFVYATLGVAYAVLLTFVVVAVWEQFHEAEATVEHEAAALSTLFDLADGFSEPGRAEVQALLAGYAGAVLEDEWGTLHRGAPSDQAWSFTDQLWRRYTTLPEADRSRVEYSESIAQMRALLTLRTQRLLESRSTLPSIIWVVLLLGGTITVAFTYLFGVRHFASQAVMTGALTIVLASSLFLIYVLDNPYRGDFRIGPEPFRSTLEGFSRQLAE